MRWGTRERLPVALAALVNGSQVHGFELDDLHRVEAGSAFT